MLCRALPSAMASEAEAALVLGGVKNGIRLDIQRSDGRIHSAVVTGTNVKGRSVAVEWLEGDETKGKSVDLAMIHRLNADLAPGADERVSSSQQAGAGRGARKAAARQTVIPTSQQQEMNSR